MMRKFVMMAVVLGLAGLVRGQEGAIEEMEKPAIPTPEAIKVGSVETVKNFPAGEVSYKIYLPTAYGKDATRVFPVVINQNPSGKTRLGVYEKWAEGKEVILLGIDGVSNGKEQGLKNQIYAAAWKDLALRGVRMHPTLKVTIGMSGGSADGMRLVRGKAEGYAGCVFMGAGQIIDRAKSEHLAYAILGGAKDEWMPGDACYAMAEKAKERGMPVIVEVEIDRQHSEAPMVRQTAALEWILEMQKLRMATLPKEEREKNLAAGRERMKKVAGIKDAGERRREAEFLLSLVPLREFKEEWSAVGTVWVDAVLELAKGESDKVKGHAMVMVEVVRSPLMAEVSAEGKGKVEAWVAEARKDGAVAKDWGIRERYLNAADLEIRAGLKVEKLKEVLLVWEELLKLVGGTEWEGKVKRRVEVVKVFIETPSTVQKPTKVPK